MKPLASLLLALAIGAAQAGDDLPRLELGIAISALSAPDYSGSEDRNAYLIPFPYIKYRGDRLRIDEGAKGLLVDEPDLEISLSGNFTFPVDDETPEREGMDELEPTVEIGPSMNYRFHRLRRGAWWVDLPLRFAYTLDSEFPVSMNQDTALAQVLDKDVDGRLWTTYVSRDPQTTGEYEVYVNTTTSAILTPGSG